MGPRLAKLRATLGARVFPEMGMESGV